MADYADRRADKIYEPPYGDPLITVRIPYDCKMGLEEAHWRFRVHRADVLRKGVTRELQRMGILDNNGKLIRSPEEEEATD